MNNLDLASLDDINSIFDKISKYHSADLIIYNGVIDMEGADDLIKITSVPSNDNVVFYLCTYGGNADAAFRIARRLQNKYKKFILYIHGYCKSAGTLIAVGSDEIIMSDFGEFGPLDVQVNDREEILKLSSSLNVFQTLTALRAQNIEFYKQYLLDIVMNLGLSTRVAANIASNLVVGFFNPILSQIDPIKIGELDRAIKIAIKYGEILIRENRGNIANEKLIQLVVQYPSHSFVIDRQEAKEIFKNVREVSDKEIKLNGLLDNMMRIPSRNKNIKKIFPVNSTSRS